MSRRDKVREGLGQGGTRSRRAVYTGAVRAQPGSAICRSRGACVGCEGSSADLKQEGSQRIGKGWLTLLAP